MTPEDKKAIRRIKKDCELAHLHETSVHDRGDLGFANNRLIQAAFPYRATPEKQWTSTNGSVEVTITALSPKRGLPYGPYPRLLMIWLASKVTENAANYDADDPARLKIFFGNHLATFMRELGIDARYSTWTDFKGNPVEPNSERLRQQMLRLFNLNIHVVEQIDTDDKFIHRETNTLASETLELHWDKHDPEYSFADSYVQLSEKFFNLLSSNPVPIDLGILRALKQSPMALDLYVWLTYRAFYARTPFTVPVPALMEQFGTSRDPEDAKDRRDFMAQLKRAVKKVHKAWPETAKKLKTGERKLEVLKRGKGLRVFPMKSSVPPKPRQ